MLVHYLNEVYRLTFESLRSSWFGLAWIGRWEDESFRGDKDILWDLLRSRFNI